MNTSLAGACMLTLLLAVASPAVADAPFAYEELPNDVHHRLFADECAGSPNGNTCTGWFADNEDYGCVGMHVGGKECTGVEYPL